MKKLRVLFISDADDQYGAPKAMLELVLELRNKYEIHPIVLTCSSCGINKLCDENNIENYVTYHRSCMIDNYHSSIKKIIKDMLRFFRYHLCKIISIQRIKKVLDLGTIDLIHSNSNRVDFGMLLSQKYQIPHVIHFREEAGGCKPFTKSIFSEMNKNADIFIAISNTVKDGWIEKGLQKEKFVTVYDGIDISDIAVKQYDSNSNIFKIVCVGSLFENKGQHIIMKAISKLPSRIKDKVYFDMYGEGEYFQDLVKLKEKLELKNVEFKGYSNNIHQLLRDYDCGIVASKKEGFGRTTVEYMAAGLCVIAANSGATIEITRDGVNALTFERDNFEELAENIERLFFDYELRKKLALNGLEMVRNHYTKENNSMEVHCVYEQVLK